MIEQAIFDVDMTVLDSFGWVFAGYQEVARRLGITLPREETLLGLWGRKVPKIIEGLWPEVEFAKIIPVVMEISRESSPPLIVGVIDTLEQIRQSGLALGLLSTTSRDLFEHQLVTRGVELEWFEKIVGGSDTEFRKPDPRAFNDFIRVRSAESIVYVGDALVDWEAARDVGLGLFLAVTTGFTSEEEFLTAGVPKNQILQSAASVPWALGIR